MGIELNKCNYKYNIFPRPYGIIPTPGDILCKLEEIKQDISELKLKKVAIEGNFPDLPKISVEFESDEN